MTTTEQPEPEALTETVGASSFTRTITVPDWWTLIDPVAAIAEQFPPIERVHKERPGGPLARRADADHENRKTARRLNRFRAADRSAVTDVDVAIAAYRERARLRRVA